MKTGYINDEIIDISGYFRDSDEQLVFCQYTFQCTDETQNLISF